MSNEMETILQIEEVLADSQPFGDYYYIRERTWLHYERRLVMLGEYVPTVKPLLSALQSATPERRFQVIGDPVVRIAIDTSLGYFKMGGLPFPPHELEVVIETAVDNLSQNKTVPPLAEGVKQYIRVYPQDACPWVWCNERSAADQLGAIFQRLFNLYHTGLSLRTPDDSSQKMLTVGAELLQNLLPKLSRSASNQLHLIAIVDAGPAAKFTSLTNPRVPGTIFLSPSVLTNPWQAAEYLLHEALHVKFIDLEHTHSLLPAHFDLTHSPKIRPVWNRLYPGNVNEWPINRSLTVMHVYTCLALFFRAIELEGSRLEGDYGPMVGLDPSMQARRAFDRARYLGEKLERHGEYLGSAGRVFVSWLMEVLDTLDPSPLLPDSYVHLLLDLYEREAEQSKRLAQRLVSDESIITGAEDTLWALKDMARSEIGRTQHILSMVGESPSSNLHQQSLALTELEASNASLGETAEVFVAIRTTVLQTLRGLSPEAYFGNEDGIKETPGEVVQEMVEYSGQHLNVLFDSLPA